MNLIKCINNHYYNRDKFGSCPQCAYASSKGSHLETAGQHQEKIPTFIPEDNRKSQYRRRPVGWLMCIEGAMRYTSFLVYEGSNHIGRSPNMDIALTLEPTVSRSLHAAITYDTETLSFFVEPNEAASLPAFLNGEPLQKRQTLQAHDQIRLGECVLCFIPLCGKNFQWTEEP